MDKKITELTEEQKAKCPQYVEEFTKIGWTFDKHISQKLAEDVITDVYKHGGLKPPKEIIRVESPRAAILTAKKYGADSFLGCYGALESFWAAFDEFFRHECGLLEETEPLQGIVRAVRNLSYFLPYENMCFVSQHPTDINLMIKGEQKNVRDITKFTDLGTVWVHNSDGKAMEWSDGSSIYSWKNIRLNRNFEDNHYSWIITNPERITADVINQEKNSEIKRIMIEKIGFAKYLEIGDAKLIDDDSRFGKLYEINMGEGREQAKIVKVVNSTQNPDGTYDEYVIPVRPTIKTAHEAVASTFPKAKIYDPSIET